jgi:hypothetical protein
MMMSHARGFAHAVIDGIGMGEALNRMLAVAEGEHRRGQGKAKGGKGRERNREPESQSLCQCAQHFDWGLVLSLQSRA